MAVDKECAQCGKQIRVERGQVRERNFCNKKCFGKYRSEHLTGDKAAHWKGGERVVSNRVMVLAPDNPMAHVNGYVYRYRLVAAEKLGRLLREDEVVHHIDGNTMNDDPGNLLVVTQREHVIAYGAHRTAVGFVPSRCREGHSLEGENLRIYARGHLVKWVCRECARATSRRYEAAHPQRKQRHASV